MNRFWSIAPSALLSCFLSLNACVAQVPGESIATSKDGKFQYEIFGTGHPLLILLHGVGGSGGPFYRAQAELFASKGYTVLMPHYFDATQSTSDPTNANYQAWINVVQTLVTEYAATHRNVMLLGYSMGASVALAAGSQDVPVNAVAEWYGSLPDEFFHQMKGMPPLLILHGENDTNIPVVNAEQLIKLCDLKQLTCESHIYPDQGHGFAGNDLKDADERTLAFFSHFLALPPSNPTPPSF